MIEINQTYVIEASIDKVWQALTDASVMDQWDAKPAKMDARVGGSFSLWDGDIHGANTEVAPKKLLRQDWYGHDNPDRKYDVTFTLEGDEKQTTVRVAHAAWDDDARSMGDGWRDYYFNPIKKLLESPENEFTRKEL